MPFEIIFSSIKQKCFSFQALESLEFPDIIPLLRPLMHTICLVYSHSTFYNSPARIIVLMTEACNLLINRGRNFLDPSSLFQVTLTLMTYYIYALISVECIPNWNKPLIILYFLMFWKIIDWSRRGSWQSTLHFENIQPISKCLQRIQSETTQLFWKYQIWNYR